MSLPLIRRQGTPRQAGVGTGPASIAQAHCDAARKRLLSSKGDPFVYAEWKPVLFLHYLVAPDVLRPIIPSEFELDTYRGKACLSLVSVSMRRFRPSRLLSPAWLLRPIAEQRCLNLRTYVRFGPERGAFFIWGWLSRPGGLPFPSSIFNLTYEFADIAYAHYLGPGNLCGSVRVHPALRFAYRSSVNPRPAFVECAPGSLAEFALEQYSGFFSRNGQAHLFRIWHPPWMQTPIEVMVEHDSLIKSKFPWFEQAKLAGANFANGFPKVWLGRAYPVNAAAYQGGC